MKHLYEYKVNWYGEILSGYTRSVNESRAIKQIIYKIAKQLGRTAYSVREYVLSSGNKIEVIKRKKEGEG